MKFSEQPGIAGCVPGSSVEIRRHRRTVDPLEDERVVPDFEYFGHGESVRPRMLHNGRFARRNPAVLEAA